MERYEYKLVAAPKARNKYSGAKKSIDLFAQTLMDSMNELATDGWQFVRQEKVTESRRTLFFGHKNRQHDYMVYRRPRRSNGMSLDEPINPRRVQKQKTPDIEQLRARISEVMLDPQLKAITGK